MATQKLNRLAESVWKSYFGENNWGTDNYGNTIYKAAYGDENSKYGWAIDHIYPKSLGNIEDLKNLRPLHIVVNKIREENPLF